MAIKTVSDATFDAEVLKSDQPIIVDYWAEWCGPCKQIAPLLEELATEKDGVVTIGKLNIDENPETPARYGVRGIPTLMLFKNGQVVGTTVGVMSKRALSDWVDSLI